MLNKKLGTQSQSGVEMNWIGLAIGAGIATCIVYPALVFVPLPRLVTVTFAASVGPLLGIASVGLFRFVRLHQPSLLAELAAISNFAAGCLFTTMLLVQLAVRIRATGQVIDDQTKAVWLGMDVAWDVYVGIGTAMFAWAMRRHPRFGLAFTCSGLLLAALLLGSNLYAFPEPPGSSGLFDLGPFVGLWYAAVTIQMWRSLSWARDVVALPSSEPERSL